MHALPKPTLFLLVFAAIISLSVMGILAFDDIGESPPIPPTPYPTPSPKVVRSYVNDISSSASHWCNINIAEEQLSLFVHGTLTLNGTDHDLRTMFALDHKDDPFLFLDPLEREIYCDIVASVTYQLHNGGMDGYTP